MADTSVLHLGRLGGFVGGPPVSGPPRGDTVPLVKIDMIEGRTEADVAALADAVHESILEEQPLAYGRDDAVAP